MLKLDWAIDRLIVPALQATKKQPWKILKEGLSIIAPPQVTPINLPSGGFPQPDLDLAGWDPAQGAPRVLSLSPVPFSSGAFDSDP